MKYIKSEMRNRFYFLAIILLSPLICQGNSSRLPEIGTPGDTPSFTNSILNPSKLQIQHGITFTTTMGNGSSQSAGIYSNFMTYRISDKWDVQTGIHLISSSGSNMFGNTNQPNVDFEMELNYRPSDNVLLQFGFAKISSNNLYYNHRFNNYSFTH
ncbi:MAG: hypothetical protein HON48_22530 [Desulfobacula sp.]|jgi:hypothetical protein|nr:hypothetical protein [Desulfobacula sp.]